MAFFDNLTKKVSEATQSVAQKGRDFADIAKLNSSISDEEKRLDNLYRQVGKLFVEKIGDRAEGPFADYVNEINSCTSKIEEFKKQLKELKGFTACPECGAELSAEALFCNSCGHKVVRQTPEANNTPSCPQCGAAVSPDALFCNSCGQKLK